VGERAGSRNGPAGLPRDSPRERRRRTKASVGSAPNQAGLDGVPYGGGAPAGDQDCVGVSSEENGGFVCVAAGAERDRSRLHSRKQKLRRKLFPTCFRYTPPLSFARARECPQTWDSHRNAISGIGGGFALLHKRRERETTTTSLVCGGDERESFLFARISILYTHAGAFPRTEFLRASPQFFLPASANERGSFDPCALSLFLSRLFRRCQIKVFSPFRERMRTRSLFKRETAAIHSRSRSPFGGFCIEERK